MPELASEYLERTLPWYRRLAVRLHLSLCSACTAYYQQLRRTVALLRGMPASPPSAEVERRVLSSLDIPPSGSPAE